MPKVSQVKPDGDATDLQIAATSEPSSGSMIVPAGGAGKPVGIAMVGMALADVLKPLPEEAKHREQKLRELGNQQCSRQLR